jgi:predicted outer membrane repeat protein
MSRSFFNSLLFFFQIISGIFFPGYVSGETPHNVEKTEYDRSADFFAETDYIHSSTMGFSTLTSATPATFKFNRNKLITITQTLAAGNGITQSNDCLIFSATSPSNPSYVAGKRSFFSVSFNTATGTGSTVSYEISFSTGLSTNGRMLFRDFDVNEIIRIKAYNASNVLIPFSDLTFTRHNGQETNGASVTTFQFSDIGSAYSGQISDNGGVSTNDIVASLQSAQVISRLVYEVEMNPTVSTSLSNTIGFNFVEPATAARIYVDHAASGANNGTTWTDAYTSLQTAFENAFPTDEVWVAKGTYKPSSTQELTTTGSRYRHFRLPNSVGVYGGFISGQTDTSQRTNYGSGGVNETILSGDLNGDDNYTVTPWTGTSENTYHIIYHPSGTCMGEQTYVNGFSLKGGYASGSTGHEIDGGAMYLTSHTPIRFSRTNFMNNYSADDGGAIYLINGSNSSQSRVYFSDATFTSNMSNSEGVVYLTNDAEANFEYVTLQQNSANTDGGGLLATNRADVNLFNVSIIGNTAGDDGGGIAVTDEAVLNAYNLFVSGNAAGTALTGDDGGGLYVFDGTANLNNATIVGNRAFDDGGGIRIEDGSLTTSPVVLNNCIVWGNQAVGSSKSGHQIFRGSGTSLTINYSCYANASKDMEGTGILTPGTGNLTSDPQFRNSVLGDYRLTSVSPSADAGNDSYNTLATDIRGSVGRKLLKSNAVSTGTIDMGAYEFHAVTDANKSWTGTVSNLWNVAGNWSDNAVPHSSDIIEINSGSAQLNTAFTTNRSVTLGGSGTLTLLPTASLSVGATGTLALGGRPVTLKSDATGTAIVGQMLGTLSGATNVTAERYMPAGRKWRFLCAPLTGSSNNSVFFNWQNNDVPNGNTGVEIWGPGGSADPSSSNTGLAIGPNPSMRSYSAGWQGVTNTNSTYLFDGTTNNGFALFQTGPYNNGSTAYIGGPGNLPAGIATTLSATGTLVSGTHTKNLEAAAAGQYFLVANPYASPYNPASFTTSGTVNRTNIENIIYMWDAKPGGTNNLGRYVSYSISAGTYSNAGAGTGYPNNSVLIQSGQSFMVQATNSGPATLVFREANKGSLNTLDMMGNTEEPSKASLRFQLWQDTINFDGAVAFFQKEASRNIDPLDGVKLMNGSENLGFRREGKTLVFEFHPELASSDTLFLHLGQMRQQTYRLIVDAGTLNIPAGMGLLLIDRFTKQETDLDPKGVNETDFTVTQDSASFGERFMVVLSGKAGSGNITAEPASENSLRIYPNPVVGLNKARVSLDGKRAPWNLKVMDALGRTMWEHDPAVVISGSLEVDLSNLGAGIYYLIATDTYGQRSTISFIRQ